MDVTANARLLRSWLRYAAERLGWPGLLGLASGIAAGVAWLMLVLPLAQANAAQREQIAELQARRAVQQESVPEPEARALAGLPGGNALLPLVGAIHAGASKGRVALDQGEYVWQRARDGRPARYRMIFPARGRYDALRAWVAVLQAAHPELVLAEFDLRRENIGSEVVEARVQFDVLVEDTS